MNIEKIEQILDTIWFLSKEETELLMSKLNSRDDELIKTVIFNNEVNSWINYWSIKFHKHDKKITNKAIKAMIVRKLLYLHQIPYFLVFINLTLINLKSLLSALLIISH